MASKSKILNGPAKKNILNDSSFKMERWDDNVRFNGINLDDFYRPNRRIGKRSIEAYIKVLFLIVSFKLNNSTKEKDFFVSTRKLLRVLTFERYKDSKGQDKVRGYGNDYCIKTIQRAIRTLEDLELIYVEKNPLKKSQMLNPNEYWNRKLHPNMEAIKELLNVYSDEDQFIKKYASNVALRQIMNDTSIPEELKGEASIKRIELYMLQLKKIVRKRPYSYIEKIEDKYKEYEKEGLNIGYNNASDMISYFILKTTSKYSVVRMFEKYIPASLKEQQKLIDAAYKKNAVPYGELSKEDLVRIKMLNEPDAHAQIDRFKGYKVPGYLQEEFKALGALISDDGFIVRYSQPYVLRKL